MSDSIGSLYELSPQGKGGPEIEIRNNEIFLHWSCPRCGTDQETKLETWELFGIDLECREKEFCGNHISIRIGLQLEYGSYKGTNDIPLDWSKKPKDDHQWYS